MLDFIPYPEQKDGATKIMANILNRLSDSFAITVITTCPEAKELPEFPKRIAHFHEPLSVSSKQRKRNLRQFIPAAALSKKQIDKLNLKYQFNDYSIIHTSLHSFVRIQSTDQCTLLAINDSMAKSSLNGTLKGYLKYIYYRQVEKKVAAFNHTLVIVSEKDALFYPSKNKLVLSNGVDYHKFRPKEGEKQDNTFVFHGVLDYQVNIDSIRYMAAVLAKSSVQFKLMLVGRMNRENANQVVKTYNSLTNCKLIGEVDEIENEITKYQFYLALMNGGAGIKNKVLEALSCGMLVCINKRAIEGLTNHPELLKAVYLIEKPSDINTATADHENWQKKSELARQYVVKHYSWEKYMKTLENHYYCSIS